MCLADLHSLSTVPIMWHTVDTTLFMALLIFHNLHITSKHLNVRSYCTVLLLLAYLVWLQLCWQCHWCFLVIISCLIYSLCICNMSSAHLNTWVMYHKNHQRTHQLSTSFAYYMLLPHVSITLLSSGRYATAMHVHHTTVTREIPFCLLIYLFTYLPVILRSRNPPMAQCTALWHHSAALSTDSESLILNYWYPVGCLQNCSKLCRLWWKGAVNVAGHKVKNWVARHTRYRSGIMFCGF
jgi:hypothetical protein